MEIAVGSGRNLHFYPADVRLTGVELSPKMLEIGRRRTRERRLGRSTRRQRPGPPFHGRLLRRGGRGARALHHPRRPLGRSRGSEGLATWQMVAPRRWLLLLEHVRTLSSPCAFCRASSTRSLILLENDHLLCEPLRHVEDAGLAVERLERSKLGIVEWPVAAGHSLCCRGPVATLACTSL